MANNMVTIIVPVHDDYLVADRLEYIRYLTYTLSDIEVIIVDDKSSSGVLSSVLSFITHNACSSWYVISNSRHMGIGYSILRGMQFARGSKIAILPPNIKVNKSDFEKALSSDGAIGIGSKNRLFRVYNTGFGVYSRDLLLKYRQYYYLGRVFWQLNFNALLKKPLLIKVRGTYCPKVSFCKLIDEYLLTNRHIKKLKGVLKNDLRTD